MRLNIALIVFAGSGSRIHSDIPKQFVKIKDVDLVVYTIKKFNDNPNIDEIVLVTSKEYIPYAECFKDKYGLDKIAKVVSGGSSRQESVRLGLEALDYDEKDNILIHDGDRPLISHTIINEAIEYLQEHDASCPYLNAEDRLQAVSNSGRKIVLSNKEVDIQTPQAFKFGLIKKMHIEKQNIEVNDDISLIDPSMVKFYLGDKFNFKVTTDKDLDFIKSYIENL